MNAEDRVEAALDDALEMTFPASDAFVITLPRSGDREGPATATHDAQREANPGRPLAQ